MRLTRLIVLVFVLIGCASTAPRPQANSPSQVSIRALLAAPATYDGQYVLVHGHVGQVLRGRMLAGGRRVTILTLVGADGQRIHAVSWGSPVILEGTLVELRGIFRAEFQIDEREHQGIIDIKEIHPLL